MTQTTVVVGLLSKKSDERSDFVWLSLKQTIDHDGSIPINGNENYDHGLSFMRQSTDHNGCLPMKVNWW